MTRAGFTFSKAILTSSAVALMLLAQGCQSSAPRSPEAEMATMTQEESALLTQGDVARSLGRYGEAMQHYQDAAALSKGAVRAHLELASMHRRNGNRQAEKAVLEQAYGLNPANLVVIRDYAQNALLTNDSEKAAELAQKGLELAPQDIRLLNLQGLTRDRAGNHPAAQESYQEALLHAATASDREVTRNNYALSLIAGGEYTRAIQMLEPQLANAQNKPALRQLLALAYGAQGDNDKAYELGLQDLTLQEVNENLRFYAQLRRGEVSSQSLFMPAN